MPKSLAKTIPGICASARTGRAGQRWALLILVLAPAGFAAACASAPPQSPVSSPAHTSSQTPVPIPERGYATAFGINYAQPARYLAEGAQSRLSNPALIGALRGKPKSLAHLGEIYFWVTHEFKTWPAGGATIGTVTVDKLLGERRLGGCHDWALVFASVARELGYPAVMVDALSITWAKQVLPEQKARYIGHVFVEVFVDRKWILIDSKNNWYVENHYDPANPVIPLKGAIAGLHEENVGFHVMRKGVDTWGYGIRSDIELKHLMDASARLLKPETLHYPSYVFQRFR